MHDPQREFEAFRSSDKALATAFAAQERKKPHGLPVRVDQDADGHYVVVVTHKP